MKMMAMKMKVTKQLEELTAAYQSNLQLESARRQMTK